jgi:ribosomal protein L19E
MFEKGYKGSKNVRMSKELSGEVRMSIEFVWKRKVRMLEKLSEELRMSEELYEEMFEKLWGREAKWSFQDKKKG